MDKNFEIEKRLINLKKYEDEKQGLIETCEKMVNYYNNQITTYLEDIHQEQKRVLDQIDAMLDLEDLKETKTQFSYKTPSFKLTKKKERFEMKLTKKDIDKIPEKFIKVKREIDWNGFKKVLMCDGDEIVNAETGEIIDIVELVKKPMEGWRF